MYIKSYSEAEGFSLSNPINRQENLNMNSQSEKGIYRTNMWSYKNILSEVAVVYIFLFG